MWSCEKHDRLPDVFRKYQERESLKTVTPKDRDSTLMPVPWRRRRRRRIYSFAFNDTIEGPRSTRLVTVPKKSLRERERERERALLGTIVHNRGSRARERERELY